MENLELRNIWKGQNLECFVSEFVGTFFLVLTIGVNSVTGTPLGPVSVGLVLMALIFATGKVSGAHFNPAVTLGLQLVYPLDNVLAGLYMVAQLSGGLAAGFAYRGVLGAVATLQPGHGYGLMEVLLAESLFTAALVFVVLGVVRAEREPAPDGRFRSNEYGGLAIGLTVMAAAFSIGTVSGCSLNPAVAFGVIVSGWAFWGSGGVSHLGLYLLSPVAGAILGAVLFLGLIGGQPEDPPELPQLQPRTKAKISRRPPSPTDADADQPKKFFRDSDEGMSSATDDARDVEESSGAEKERRSARKPR